MTILEMLLLVVAVVVIAMVCYWLIQKFFPEPAKTIALFIVGILLLVALLLAFFPGIGGVRLSR